MSGMVDAAGHPCSLLTLWKYRGAIGIARMKNILCYTLLCSFLCWRCCCGSQLLLVGLRLPSARRKGLLPAGTQGTEKAECSAPLSLPCTVKQDLVLTHSYLSWARVTGTQTQSKATLGPSQFVCSQGREPMYPKDLMTSHRHFGILF